VFSVYLTLTRIVNNLALAIRSAKFDTKFINFFARLFILFYRSPMNETFRTLSKIKEINERKSWKNFASNFTNR